MQRVGPVGEGFFQLPVDAQPVQGGRQRPQDPVGPWEAALRGRAFLHRFLRPLAQVDLTPPDGADVDGFGNDCQGWRRMTRPTEDPATPTSSEDRAGGGGGLPLSVWPTAQQTARVQRAGRYLPESTAHPAKMLPAIARHAIAAYTEPGEVVVDPMCGIGTTLVEAAHLGRHAIGVEYEARWAELARANLAHAAGQGAPGGGRVVQGDARRVTSLLDPGVVGRVALVLTSPPYGSSVHGQAKAEPGRGVAKWHDRYGSDPANLAHASLPALLAAMGEILAGCAALLRPGGLVVLTARPWRRRELLVDFPGALVRVGEQAGLVAFERNVALLVGLRGERLVPRPSFFQLDMVRKARARGLPLRIIAHEDVLVLRRLDPTAPAARTRSGQPQAPDGQSASERGAATPSRRDRPRPRGSGRREQE